jgi:hypothetical protein
MAKISRFRRFLTALKRHWKTALPAVTSLAQPPSPLRSGLTFDAGCIKKYNQHVYLDFQTTGQEAGRFTINVILVDDGTEPNTVHVWKPIKLSKKLECGAHRIGNFLAQGHHDKWWHLCEVEASDTSDDPEYWRNLRLELREGNWTAPTYDNETEVIDAAVADVTNDVQRMLRAICSNAV